MVFSLYDSAYNSSTLSLLQGPGISSPSPLKRVGSGGTDADVDGFRIRRGSGTTKSAVGRAVAAGRAAAAAGKDSAAGRDAASDSQLVTIFCSSSWKKKKILKK